MDIYLIRHTKVAVEDICYGYSDVALADSFLDEWETLKRKLPPHFDALYASPLLRCQTLVKMIEADKKITDAAIKELNFGDWELKKWKDIDAEQLDGWMANFVEARAPNGESFRDLYRRTTGFFENVVRTTDQSVAIVTHGGVIRCLLAHVLGFPLAKAFDVMIDYGKVSVLHISDEGRWVKCVNV
jgi:alpha-ribazole phosphatase